MTTEKIKKYREILEIIWGEQDLNSELISYGTKEVRNLESQRNEALKNVEFYVTASFDADSYTKKRKEALLNIILKCAQNGFDLPQSDNEAINIANENSVLAHNLNNQIKKLTDEIIELAIHQIELDDFANKTNQQIKVLTK